MRILPDRVALDRLEHLFAKLREFIEQAPRPQ